MRAAVTFRSLKWWIEDFLRYSWRIRRIIGAFAVVVYPIIRWRRSQRARINHLLACARLLYGTGVDLRLVRSARSLLQEEIVDLPVWFSRSEPASIDYGLILKAPSGDERGVLLVCFEYNWVRLLRHGALTQLARDYLLVVSPTWSPPYEPGLMLLDQRWPDPFVSMLSNFADQPRLGAMGTGIRIAPVLASSWTLSASVSPLIERDIDVLVLANFAKYKRHFALFTTLAKSEAQTICVVGIPLDGRTETDIRREAEDAGLDPGRLEIRDGGNPDVVRDSFRRSRLLAIGSLVEGSCLAVAEALSAGIPVAMFAGCHVGSAAFINPETGTFVPRWNGHHAINSLLRRSASLRPAAWMTRQGADCHGSTRILNRVLRDLSRELEQPWHSDIVPHTIRRLAPHYLSAAEAARFREVTNTFGTHYGITLNAGELPVV